MSPIGNYPEDKVSSDREIRLPKAPTVEVSKGALGSIRLNHKLDKATEFDSSFMSSKVNRLLNHVNELPTPITQTRQKSHDINKNFIMKAPILSNKAYHKTDDRADTPVNMYHN